MTNITPTVGRIVWYFAEKMHEGYRGPYAAIITKVWSNTCVNLTVAHSDGSVVYKPDVHMIPPHTQAPSYPHAQWMPYQVGQAQSAEKLADEVMGIVKIKLANEYGIFPSHSKAGQGKTPPPPSVQPKQPCGSQPPKSHLRKVLDELSGEIEKLEKAGFRVEGIDVVV